MQDKLLQTPDGVRDTYGIECKKKRKITHKLHHVMESYSYHDIETPTFEFFDIFNRDKGSAPSNEMYKFFDRDNNTLVLRPDITPSIARCVAKYYKDEELPVRLCYTGNTYTNTRKLQGKLKEVTQIGAELINDDSSAADAEIIATVVDCFQELGSGSTSGCYTGRRYGYSYVIRKYTETDYDVKGTGRNYVMLYTILCYISG
jgi:ATP phosphoribosyltransferase regulatory subunit